MSEQRLSGTTSDAVAALLDEVTTDPQATPAFETKNLRGQVAIVTGGSSGIGRAVALELARCGVHIGFCFLDENSRSGAEAQEVARELRQMEVRVFSSARATCTRRARWAPSSRRPARSWVGSTSW